MNILLGSDFHGDEIALNRFVELLSDNYFSAGILAGDLMSKSASREEHQKKEKKIKQILIKPGKTILFVMGNSDGNAGINWKDFGLLKNIHNKQFIIENQSFAGYQFSNPLSNSPFEKSEEDQLKDFDHLSEIVDKSTILVTHAPAFNVLDWRFMDGEGMHMGSKMISKLIELKNPKLHLHGHAHQSTGIQGNSINGAYKESHKFVSLDLKNEEYKFID